MAQNAVAPTKEPNVHSVSLGYIKHCLKFETNPVQMDLLVLSTLSCILFNVIPSFINYILRYIYMRKKYDVDLLKNLEDWKHQMSEISMVDEFAAYAKLQRKCNVAESVISKNRNQRQISLMKQQLFLSYILNMLNGILILWLLYRYMTEPVIILAENALWPIQKLLSWPCQYENAISLPVWLIIVLSGISACKTLRA